MRRIPSVLLLLPLFLLTAQVVWATNEGSYQQGFWQGSETGPLFTPGDNYNPMHILGGICAPSPSYTTSNGVIMPAITNTTACQNGFYSGYKTWCINHAVNCVQNITIGDFPDMIVKAHQEYLAGAKVANGSGNSMCPIGSN